MPASFSHTPAGLPDQKRLSSFLPEFVNRRLQVPQDVMVAGVDDVEIARMTSPSLTTVHQPCAEIARAAFDLLEWRTRKPDAVARRVELASRLVVRVSTGKTTTTKVLRRKTK